MIDNNLRDNITDIIMGIPPVIETIRKICHIGKLNPSPSSLQSAWKNIAACAIAQIHANNLQVIIDFVVHFEYSESKLL